MRASLLSVLALTLLACDAADAPRAVNPYDPDVHGPGYDACEIQYASGVVAQRSFDHDGRLSHVHYLGAYVAPDEWYGYAEGHTTRIEIFDRRNQSVAAWTYDRDDQGGLALVTHFVSGARNDAQRWHLDTDGAPLKVDYDQGADGTFEPGHGEIFERDQYGCPSLHATRTADGASRERIHARTDDCAPIWIEQDFGADGTIDRVDEYVYDEADPTRLVATTSQGVTTQAYDYDELGRLIRIGYASGPPDVLRYDCAGM